MTVSGFALFDRLERTLPNDPHLKQVMWRQRELENYLCEREVLLEFAYAEGSQTLGRTTQGDVFGFAWREQMELSLTDIESALQTLGEPSPWGADIKASEDFLDRVFKSFYERLELPNLMTKTDYHRLAAFIEPDNIDQEIVEVLDAIMAVAEQASPVKDNH